MFGRRKSGTMTFKFDSITDEDLEYLLMYNPLVLDKICILWTLNLQLNEEQKLSADKKNS